MIGICQTEGSSRITSQILHIVYASDRNYAEMLGVSMISLFENNRGNEIRLYILDGGIAEEDLGRMEDICRSYGQPALCRIPAEDISGILNMDVAADRGSRAQFSRIFISRYIDESIDRILYLDCDTIIRRPLTELWNIDLGGHTIAALDDAFSVQYRKNADLQPDDIMFNSGVMLIDLKKWRDSAAEEKALSFIRSRHGFAEKGDQGVLNAVLSRECLCFDPVFNAVTIFFDFSYKEMLAYRKPPAYYSEEEVARAVRDPVIIHYTMSFLSKRPWMTGCRHPWTDEWLKYKKMSPWRDVPPAEEHRSWRVRAMRRLPRPLMLWSAGLLQAYGRPWLYRVRLKKLMKKQARRA